MGIFDFILGSKNKEGELIHELQEYKKRYRLLCENKLIFGKESIPLSSQTSSIIEIEQEVFKKNILTRLITIDFQWESESEQLKTASELVKNLSEISPKIEINRNLKGQILKVKNKNQLIKEWNHWKKNRLSEIYEDEKQRTAFIKTYEKGIETIDYSIKNNLTYQLILPECLAYRSYVSELNPDKSKTKSMYSKLIPKMLLEYEMHLSRVSGKSDDTVVIKSHIKNQEELERTFLKKLYEQNETFSMSQYEFHIEKKYLFNKNTSEIISGKLVFKESMHENLKYSINMSLEQF